MDVCSSYNEMPMYNLEKDKIAFLIEQANYHYNMIPPGLKNVGEMY